MKKIKKLTEELDKYATRKVFCKGLNPYWNVYDKYGALLYQYDMSGDYIYLYETIKEYKNAIK